MENTSELSVMQSIDLAIERGERLDDKQIADIIGPGPKGYFLRLFKFPALTLACVVLGLFLVEADNGWGFFFIVVSWLFAFFSLAGLVGYGMQLIYSLNYYYKLREGLKSGKIIPDFYVPKHLTTAVPFIIDAHNEKIYIRDRVYDLNDVDGTEWTSEESSNASFYMLNLRMCRGEEPIIGVRLQSRHQLPIQRKRLDNFLREYWNG